MMTKNDVHAKWLELYDYLKKSGVDSPLLYLNNLVNDTYTGYTFNNAGSWEEQYSMLCGVEKIMKARFEQTHSANKTAKKTTFSQQTEERNKVTEEVDSKWMDLLLFLRKKQVKNPQTYLYQVMRDFDFTYDFNNSDPEGQLLILCELERILKESFEGSNRFAKALWAGNHTFKYAGEESLRQSCKDRFGEYFPNAKMLNKILVEHDSDLRSYMEDNNFKNEKDVYKIDNVFNWLGY